MALGSTSILISRSRAPRPELRWARPRQPPSIADFLNNVFNAQTATHTSQPHSLVVQGTRLVCSVCVRSSALSSLRCARSAFATSACTGAPPQAAVGPGHQIYRTEGLIWCNACGAYGEKRRGKLQSACPGFPGQGAKTILRRLRANLHPATAAPMSASVRVLG